MRKLILIMWDYNLGPQNIVQFPPEAEFPKKEILLKLWARHEITQDSDFVYIQDSKEKLTYCSLLASHPLTNQTYLIILDLDPNSNLLIYREILERVKDDLIKNLNSEHFSHVLTETYRIIKTQSEMDEIELFYRLFEDKSRLEILNILRQGVISKKRLTELIQNRWGVERINLDLLITPLIRLGMIKIKDVPGSRDCVFLVKDVYCCRIPPKSGNTNKAVLAKIKQIIEFEGIIVEDSIQPLMRIMQQPGVKELCALISEDVEQGIPFDVALTVVKYNRKFLHELEKFYIIHIHDEKNIFPVTQLNFNKFDPVYLPQILSDRYLAEDISFDQLLAHLQLLNFPELYK